MDAHCRYHYLPFEESQEDTDTSYLDWSFPLVVVVLSVDLLGLPILLAYCLFAERLMFVLEMVVVQSMKHLETEHL